MTFKNIHFKVRAESCEEQIVHFNLKLKKYRSTYFTIQIKLNYLICFTPKMSNKIKATEKRNYFLS